MRLYQEVLMFKTPFLYGVITLSILLLLNCSNNGEPKSKKDLSNNPVAGGTLIIGISGDVDSFNPFYGESVSAQEITHLMLLGLADLDEHSDFKPEIARSWERSTDYSTLTYHLRRDAVWSDGFPITAHDVKFTYDLLMDEKVGSPLQGITEFIQEVSVVDSYTVTFTFSKAYPTQIFDTAREILPRHILKDIDPKNLRSHPFGKKPISSGPFKLKEWVEQQYIELVPNESYFGKKPYLDRVIFKIIPDQTNLLMQLKAGEIDMMTGVPLAEVDNLQANNPEINIRQVSGRVYYYIGYNQKNALFKNVQVRRALTMAINREQIIEGLLHGYGKKCYGPLPPIVEWAYTEDVETIAYDPRKARRILNNNKWIDQNDDGLLEKNNQPFEFTLITPTGNQLKSDVATVVQSHLSKIGIKVHIKVLEWTNFLKHLQSKNFDACVGALSTSFYVDPTPVFHSKSTHLFNAISYSNPKIDRLIEEGRKEMDRQKAKKIWDRFQKEIYGDQPFTFLFWADNIVAINKKFRDVTPIALSSVYNLEYWHKRPIQE
ncbi:MAG: hypothetical protein GF313_16405 [Caldithrix sp.]|nr:hypothetical protein [Caldithrix sp.]